MIELECSTYMGGTARHTVRINPARVAFAIPSEDGWALYMAGGVAFHGVTDETLRWVADAVAKYNGIRLV